MWGLRAIKRSFKHFFSRELSIFIIQLLLSEAVPAVLIYVVPCRVILRLERLSQLKNRMTSSGIERL
jgi:hypothetical protein